MKPGLAVLLAGAIFVAAPGGAHAFAQADTRSPDGRYALISLPDRQEREDGHGDLVRGGLYLFDNRTGRELGAYDPHARSFEVMWSPDGKLVAINADLHHLDTELTVWRVGSAGWRLVRLPAALVHGEGSARALDRLIPKTYAGRIAYGGDGAVPIAEKWHNPTDLEASLALDGREKRREVLSSFLVVVRFFRMGCEILEEKRTSFKVL